MPALDFPSSPTNGQVYGNWVYNSSKLAWQSRPLTPAKTVNSPTAPTSPADGDQWFNTNTGQLFIYYTDTNGSQWVESRAPITADGYVSPNYLINGAFDIWQRGTSGFANNAYCADRWIASINNSAITRTSMAVGSLTTYGLTFTTSSATNTNGILQALESTHANALRGKTVTLSFYAQASSAGATLLADIQTSATADAATTSFSVLKRETLSTSTSLTRYTVTTTIPADSTSAGIRVVIMASNLPSGATFTVTGVQLEEGATATPFRRNANSIQAELAACQRYFQILVPAGYDTNHPVIRESATQCVATFFLPVTMRVAPTLLSGTTVCVGTTTIGRVVMRDTAFGVSAPTCNYGGVYNPNPGFVTMAMTHTSVGGAAVFAEFDTLTSANYLAASAEL